MFRLKLRTVFEANRISDSVSESLFSVHIKMTVKLGGDVHIGMSEPFRNVIKLTTLRQKQSSTAVTQIVKSDTLQIILFQKLLEMF